MSSSPVLAVTLIGIDFDVNQRRESNVTGNKIIIQNSLVFWSAILKNKMKFSKGTYKISM